MILQHLGSAFVGLRGHLSDELREVNFCRVRLAELERLFSQETAEGPGCSLKKPGASQAAARGPQPQIGKTYYLSGCKTLSGPFGKRV